MKKKIFTIIAIICLSVPVSAGAVSLSDLNMQIADLLAKVFNLKAQLSRVSTTATDTTTDTTPAISSDLSCLRLNRNLAQGDSGSDVTNLQLFLSRNSYIYPEAIISGYFGASTERAVQRYQVSRGIVAYGTSATTGYGIVGPSTRTEMSSKCPDPATGVITTDDTTITVQESDVLISPIEALPVTGNIPFDSKIRFTLASKCVSFYLDWGDGSAPLSVDNRDTVCESIHNAIIVNHVYPKNGTYTVILRAGLNPSSSQIELSLPIVSYKAIVAGNDTRSFSLSPTSGLAPLSTTATFTLTHPACTSYSIDWGDTTRSDFEVGAFSCSENLTTRSISHIYSNPDTYSVLFRKGHASIANLPILEQWQVTVKELANNKAVVNVSETSGYAPVTVTINLSGTYGYCSSYEVDWGDGSSSQSLEYLAEEDSEFSSDDFIVDGDIMIEDDGCSGVYKNTFIHTYNNLGTYPLRIKFGKGLLDNIDIVQHWVSVFSR